MLCNDDSYYCRRAGGGRRNRCEDLASYVCRVKVLSYYFSSGSFFGGHVLSYIKPRTGPKCLMKISQCGSGGNREFWQWLFQENPAASLMKRESQLTCITNYVISRAVQYLEKWSKRPRFHISPRSFADPPYQQAKDSSHSVSQHINGYINQGNCSPCHAGRRQYHQKGCKARRPIQKFTFVLINPICMSQHNA